MIYFVQRANDRAIKIGTTIRLSKRLRDLRTVHGDCEVLAVMDGSYADESALHQRFADLLIEGREWFTNAGHLVVFIGREGRPWDGTDEVPDERIGIRVDVETRRRAAKAAAMMEMSLADYASDVLRKAAERDIARDAAKETKRFKGDSHE